MIDDSGHNWSKIETRFIPSDSDELRFVEQRRFLGLNDQNPEKIDRFVEYRQSDGSFLPSRPGMDGEEVYFEGRSYQASIESPDSWVDGVNCNDGTVVLIPLDPLPSEVIDLPFLMEDSVGNAFDRVLTVSIVPTSKVETA
ncbi:MAG: hypothetical protein A3G32_01385 [Deltaproteobacteria bacterium RIFCSPLOWO2_12_FULL_40_28]|nr:MAG: hypothetical protein A3C45_10270 [Deltaproteobacteria bacterium RIFCSPHIGHO2_02_FULL_40_28]OGQ19981.1 MAG: hypothetical protein A3E27_07220 [Deltaproteobacteria bacterium RIFCSPHIGHO2_12_FULL_40_32]OGQ39741.1 MAG: hypothetical protein A3I69_06650 [Deltaproteobacteria bacterium RIFCSPLOWO2_02_FULL_40_36]OGQ52996.1 MAG: hypothetical protein A3G32_01385 [Deltaproteobacteria bacterium RIFCSPLOWO2_12_FULL_40_28]